MYENNEILPTFIIGGAPRSGTTFLCHVLDKHPDVFMAKPFTPEPKICLKPCIDGTDGYRKQYTEIFLHAKNKKALGEKSSAYLENSNALENLKKVFLGHDVRFLFIVREPVKRAYSNYLRTKQNGLENLSFKEAVKAEGTREDPFPPEKAFVRPFDYLCRGDYATFAERYIRAFGRDKITFVLFENIIHSPDRFYYDIQDAVGIEPLPRYQIETPPVNMTDKAEEMDPLYEAELREWMKPKVERFAHLTGLDITVWGY